MEQQPQGPREHLQVQAGDRQQVRCPGAGEGVVVVGIDHLPAAEQQRRGQRGDLGIDPRDQPFLAPAPDRAATLPEPAGHAVRIGPDARGVADGQPEPHPLGPRRQAGVALTGVERTVERRERSGRLQRPTRRQVGAIPRDRQIDPPRRGMPALAVVNPASRPGWRGSVPRRRGNLPGETRARRTRPRAPTPAGAARPRHGPGHPGPGPTTDDDASRPRSPPGSPAARPLTPLPASSNPAPAARTPAPRPPRPPSRTAPRADRQQSPRSPPGRPAPGERAAATSSEPRSSSRVLKTTRSSPRRHPRREAFPAYRTGRRHETMNSRNQKCFDPASTTLFCAVS